LAVASVTDRQIDANLRASTIIFCTLVYTAEFLILILRADAIWIFVADFIQRNARAFAAFELSLWIANFDFARAIFLVASVGAFGFAIAIQIT
jgi:hypothetical protein